MDCKEAWRIAEREYATATNAYLQLCDELDTLRTQYNEVVKRAEVAKLTHVGGIELLIFDALDLLEQCDVIEHRRHEAQERLGVVEQRFEAVRALAARKEVSHAETNYDVLQPKDVVWWPQTHH